MSTDIDVFHEQKPDNTFFCHDWPETADEYDLDTSTETISKNLIKSILSYDKKYYDDYSKSIEFLSKVQVPHNKQVKLSKVAGCLLCHSLNIEPAVHYALISGLCDIRAVQYYLISKGQFFKSWYIKSHLKHININTVDFNKVLSIDEKQIIDNQIKYLNHRINELELLQNAANKTELSILRKQLKEFIEIKFKLGGNLDEGESKVVKFDDIVKEIQINR